MDLKFVIIYLINLTIVNFVYLKSKLISSKFGLYKKNGDNTPLIGGLGLFIFFLILYFSLIFINGNFLKINESSVFFLVLIIFLIGLYDDLREISYVFRLIFIYIILIIFLNFNEDYLISYLYFESLDKTFLLNEYSLIVTPFFILLLLNSLNMADGINGNSAFIVLSYIILLYEKNNDLNFFVLGIIFPLIIFLFYNFQNKVYLGDSGVYLLSILISLYVIKRYNYGSEVLSCEKIFLIFMVPGIDMFRLFIERLIKNKNPFKGDLNHLHHLLIKNFGLKKSIFAYISMIIWPNFIYLIFNFNIIILIVLNIIFYCSILIYLKKLKKLSN